MPTTAKPNILFLFTDDQRFDTIRALGHPDIITPTLDSLVESGTTFTHAHIMGGTSPAVCMPSRAMIMTGRTLYQLQDAGQEIPHEHTLLGEALQAAGYNTFGTGKWHNGTSAYARSFTAGAEIFFGGMTDHWNVPTCDFDPSGEYTPNPYCVNPASTTELKYRRCDHIKAGVHSSALLADAAIDFLRACSHDKPFFAYVSFLAPHDPRTMPQQYLDMYDPQAIRLPPNFMPAHPFDNGELRIRDELLEQWPRTEAAIRRHIAEYYAMITHVDAQMGRILQALDASGQRENTIIVFAGDNGLAVGQHGLMGKQNLYDHSVRVPLIFSGPGIPAGQRSSAHAYLLDIFPTLCDLIDASPPASVLGRSLKPALDDPTDRIRDTLYCGYMGLQRSVRDERHKLIEYVVQGQRRTQLFDLQEDPWELSDCSAAVECAPVLARLRQAMKRWRDALDDAQGFGEPFWQGYAD